MRKFFGLILIAVMILIPSLIYGMPVEIINATDITSETEGIVYIKEHKNIIIQNEITCGSSDSISVKYYGTIFEEAAPSSDVYWVDITETLFKEDAVTCADETVRNMGVIDTDITFVKIKAVVSVISAVPDNKVEIYYEC